MIDNTVFKLLEPLLILEGTDLQPVHPMKEAKIIHCLINREQWWGHAPVPLLGRGCYMCGDVMHDCLVFWLSTFQVLSAYSHFSPC
jgi:hypothetical protein